MGKWSWTACLLGVAVTWRAEAGEILFENARFRAALGHDAVWRSVVAKDTGKDYCAKDKTIPFAAARVGD